MYFIGDPIQVIMDPISKMVLINNNIVDQVPNIQQNLNDILIGCGDGWSGYSRGDCYNQCNSYSLINAPDIQLSPQPSLQEVVDQLSYQKIASTLLVLTIQDEQAGHHEIYNVCVAPEFRGKKLAAKMLDVLFQMVSKDLNQFMWLAVDANNVTFIQAFKTYVRMGFKDPKIVNQGIFGQGMPHPMIGLTKEGFEIPSLPEQEKTIQKGEELRHNILNAVLDKYVMDFNFPNINEFKRMEDKIGDGMISALQLLGVLDPYLSDVSRIVLSPSNYGNLMHLTKRQLELIFSLRYPSSNPGSEINWKIWHFPTKEYIMRYAERLDPGSAGFVGLQITKEGESAKHGFVIGKDHDQKLYYFDAELTGEKEMVFDLNTTLNSFKNIDYYFLMTQDVDGNLFKE